MAAQPYAREERAVFLYEGWETDIRIDLKNQTDYG